MSALTIRSPGATTSGLILPSSVGPPELQSIKFSQLSCAFILVNSKEVTDILCINVAFIMSTMRLASLGPINKTDMFTGGVIVSLPMFINELSKSLFMITKATAFAL